VVVISFQTGPLEYMLRLTLVYFISCIYDQKQFQMKSYICFNYLLLLILQSMNMNVQIKSHSTICKTLTSHKTNFVITLQNCLLSTSIVIEMSQFT
jgi:hypothetical protein